MKISSKMTDQQTKEQMQMTIYELTDEVAALEAALKHLVLEYKKYDNGSIAMHCAENALKRHEKLS